MTGPEHYREAERLAGEAETWADADYGWKGNLTSYGWKGNLTSGERIARRNGDLAAAQVHATLALAAAFADGPAVMRPEDRDEWDGVLR